jgi:hypothetical protein
MKIILDIKIKLYKIHWDEFEKIKNTKNKTNNNK